MANEINTIPELVDYLRARLSDIWEEQNGYEDERPDGAEDVEDNMLEAELSAAEGEIATLLRLVTGEDPYS